MGLAAHRTTFYMNRLACEQMFLPRFSFEYFFSVAESAIELHAMARISDIAIRAQKREEKKMDARKIVFDSIRDATAAIEKLGSGNSRLMASRAIHVNVLVRDVPGPEARFLKTVYNDIGAEAAISHQAYFEENGAVTDMIVMGTIYQHREVRRILTDNPRIRPWLEAIGAVVENSPESVE